MSRAHVLALPAPAQGHVNPLLDLSHELVKHGIKVTFVNEDSTHKQIMKAQEAKGEENKEQVGNDRVQLVSIPDSLKQDEEANSRPERVVSISEVMPKKLEKLIQDINEESDNEKISCVIADGTIGWALEVAEKMGIQRAVLFWPASASFLALFLSIPKLLHDGIIDGDGRPTKDQIIQLAPEMPAMRTTHFLWTQVSDNLNAQKNFFNFIMRGSKNLESKDWVICNSSIELESPAFAFAPKALPIGPLQGRKSNQINHLAGSFWPEDSTCLNWLDLQPDKSVIYVAFGSLAKFDHTQMQELALGLELSNKPFLWVVRLDINDVENYDFLKGIEDRLFSRGKLVSWAPQQKVLSHPSIACFLSHCGWNSTIEGVINGVPFLCWPYFADQFLNETYICDIWKVGLRLDRNSGIISREEIASKIKQVLLDEGFRGRASQLKEKAVRGVKYDGSSNKNLNNFIDWIKGTK
ncbi:hypothetical protein QN277_019921 [Acacia crassicarpa]|uniref:Glycosyltransferase N-terminal domain-containing protein n=1 Tax=Acacia crassicarpa TaxID=499986 RepID=A0AAE1MRL5_9FABA|nr:hypothetical protein QN277_019921 [Acacia crassicarpa]